MRMSMTEAEACLTALNAYYHRTDLPKITEKVWVQTFLDFEYEDAWETVLAWGKNQKWFPSVAELREAITALENHRKETSTGMVRIAAPIYTEDNPEPKPGQVIETMEICRRTIDRKDPMNGLEARNYLHQKFDCPPGCELHPINNPQERP